MQLNEPSPDTQPLPPHPATSSAVLRQLAHAHHALAEADRAPVAVERYVAAHRAALHIAAAFLAVRGRPEGSERARRRIRSAWSLLAEASPELAEWSRYFQASAGRRELAEAGVHTAVTADQAAELLAAVHQFQDLVERTLHPDPQLPHARAAGPGVEPSPVRGRRRPAPGTRQ